jgi:general secretion pathway protein A
MSQQHRQALAALLYGVRTNDGFVLLTGEVGTGKTTTCRCLVEQLPETADVALILNPRLTPVELISSVCDELKISYPDGTGSIKQLIDVLNHFLLGNHAAGRQTILIIDEAQSLSFEALEQVRLLTNLETSQTKLLQVILIGQPELRDLLAREDLRQLSQRITARCHLVPFTRAETSTYIGHRLQLAGASRPLFEDRAIDVIFHSSKGIPRLINVMADRALLGAFAEGLATVDNKVARRAVDEVLLASQSRGIRAHAHLPARAMVVLLCVGLFGGLWYASGAKISWPTGLLETLDPRLEVAALESEETPPLEIPAGAPPAVDLVAGKSAALTAAPKPQEPRESSSLEERDEDTAEQAPVLTETLHRSELVPTDQAVLPLPRLVEQLEALAPAATSSAWPSLYQLWGFESTAPDERIACAQAKIAGLACLKVNGSWSLLLRFNRPAILPVLTPSGSWVPAVLQRVTDDHVSLIVAGEVLRASRAAVEAIWFGTFQLLWQLPPSGRDVLLPGMRNTDVKWLRERIESATGKAVAGTTPDLYDDALVSAIRSLQRSQALEADGIAGARTLVALNNLLADTPVPRLTGTARSITGPDNVVYP